MSHLTIGILAVFAIGVGTVLLVVSIVIMRQPSPVFEAAADVPPIAEDPLLFEESVMIKPAPALQSRLPTNATKTRDELVGHLDRELGQNEVEKNTGLDTDIPQTILLDVPFTPQAPFGEWHDPRQDYGCEEASSLMVWSWLQGLDLTASQAKQAIVAMSDWELATYGDFHDRSAADTAQMIKDYFGHETVRVEFDITIDDIRRELIEGHPVVVPVNGKLLDNPYYTPPGPLQHMVVVVGFDDETQEMITNDPGTKRGQGLRYSYENFEASLRDYETGQGEPILEQRQAMIVVEPTAN